MQKYDLIIVGAGNLGTFHAYHALKLGKKVLLVERDAAPNEATVRNFGQIVPSGQALNEWFDFGRDSLKIYNEIQKKSNISVRKNGSFYLASNEEELVLLHEAAYLFAERDYKVKIQTIKDCLKNVNGLKKKYIKGGLFFPKEISVEPHKMIHLLLKQLNKDPNLDYTPNTTVIAAEIVNNLAQITTSKNEKYIAEKILICNGYDFKTLLPSIFVKSKMKICKLQMLQTHPYSNFDLPGNILTGLSIRRYDSFKSCPSYTKLKATEIDERYKEYGIHILFKQAKNGSIIIGDSHEYIEADASKPLNFSINQEINDLILSEAKNILNLPHWLIKTSWPGFYSKTDDDTIFEHDIESKIYIATGIGGKGMTTAPGFSKKSIDSIFEN